MKRIIIAAGLLALCLGPTQGWAQSFPYALRERPAPPTEPSIAVPDKTAAAKAETPAPKTVVRHIVVQRRAKGIAIPVTMPPAEVLVIMVRAALAGLNQANFTENYSVLHAMTTPALQARVSPAHFAKVFANLRNQNLDLSPVLVLMPQFTVAPSMAPHGLLRLTGIFPSRPLQIKFTIDYLPVDGFWLIDAISVSAEQTVAAAPAAPAPAAVAALPATQSARPAPAEPKDSPYTAAPFIKSGFWEARFTKTTHFGPRLSFVAIPR
jgi:hypothetical protein